MDLDKFVEFIDKLGYVLPFQLYPIIDDIINEISKNHIYIKTPLSFIANRNKDGVCFSPNDFIFHFLDQDDNYCIVILTDIPYRILGSRLIDKKSKLIRINQTKNIWHFGYYTYE